MQRRTLLVHRSVVLGWLLSFTVVRELAPVIPLLCSAAGSWESSTRMMLWYLADFLRVITECTTERFFSSRSVLLGVELSFVVLGLLSLALPRSAALLPYCNILVWSTLCHLERLWSSHKQPPQRKRGALQLELNLVPSEVVRIAHMVQNIFSLYCVHNSHETNLAIVYFTACTTAASWRMIRDKDEHSLRSWVSRYISVRVSRDGLLLMEDVQPDTIDSSFCRQGDRATPAGGTSLNVPTRSLQQRQTAAASKYERDCRLLEREFGRGQLEYSTQGWQSTTSLPGFQRLPHDVQRVATDLADIMPEAYVGLDLRDTERAAGVTVVAHNYPDNKTGHQLHIPSMAPFEIVYPDVKPEFLDIGKSMGRQQHDVLAEVLQRNRERLLTPNTAAVLVSGVLVAGGVELVVPCIRVVVLSKGIIPLGSWVLPHEVEGVPVDVVDGSLPKLEMRREGRKRPDWDEKSVRLTKQSWNPFNQSIYSGSRIETNEFGNDFGTFGAVVTGREAELGETRYGLTCAHVIDDADNTFYRTYLPGILSKVGQKDDNPPYFKGFVNGQNSNYVDAGLFRLCKEAHTSLHPGLKSVFNSRFHITSVPRLTGTGSAHEGGLVFKHGAASGLTDGTVMSSGTVQTYTWQLVDRDKKLRLILTAMNCFFVKRRSFLDFSDGGDSGSLVFKLNDPPSTATVVGLHFGGWKEAHVSCCCHIDEVLNQLNCDIVF